MREAQMQGEAFELPDADNVEDELPVELADQPFKNLIRRNRERSRMRTLLNVISLVILVLFLYYVGMVLQFQYRITRHLEQKQYDEALAEFDRISLLPFMRYKTTVQRLRTLYDADKWEQLKEEADKASIGWYCQCPEVWYLKGMAEYHMNLKQECEQSFLYSNYLSGKHQVRSKLMLHLLNRPKAKSFQELEFL